MNNKVAICLVVLALGPAACGSSIRASKHSAAESEHGRSKGTKPDGAKKDKSGKHAATATAAPPATLAPATSVVPAYAGPPKVGAYSYTVTYNGKKSTRRTTISTESSSSSVTKMAERAAADKASATQHVVWTKAAKSLANTESAQGKNHYDCDWNPDMIQYEFPMRIGLRWTQDTACTVTYQGVKITTKVHNDTTVRSTGQVTVAGRTVKVWVIETLIKNSSTYADKTSSGEVKRTTEFAPEIGLAVRYTESGDPGNGKTTATFELQNTAPS